MRSFLGLTLGDGAGIGPEVVLKVLQKPALFSLCHPVVIGDSSLLNFWEKQLQLKLPRRCEWVDCPVLSRSTKVVPGKINAQLGAAAVAFIEQGVRLALQGEIQALVTAPIQKQAIRLAGCPFPGHTEFLAQLCHVSRFSMMFVGGGLKIVLVTIHEPLKKVSSLLTRAKVVQAMEHAVLAAKLFGVRRPHIAVAGFNPHASEGGLLGSEEKRVIAPAITAARRRGWNVTGPYPPDTLFYRARHEKMDVIVVMYHDQGLIPLKMMAFEESVNITLGLPFIRTSPDHGTAYNIAGKGIADPRSMWEAVKVAAQLCS